MRYLSLLVASLLVATGLSVASSASADAPTPVTTWFAERPCQYEDSVNCGWDAGTQGNGGGHSFIVRQVPGSARMVCVFYTERSYARTHDYCQSTR